MDTKNMSWKEYEEQFNIMEYHITLEDCYIDICTHPELKRASYYIILSHDALKEIEINKLEDVCRFGRGHDYLHVYPGYKDFIPVCGDTNMDYDVKIKKYYNNKNELVFSMCFVTNMKPCRKDIIRRINRLARERDDIQNRIDDLMKKLIEICPYEGDLK